MLRTNAYWSVDDNDDDDDDDGDADDQHILDSQQEVARIALMAFCEPSLGGSRAFSRSDL